MRGAAFTIAEVLITLGIIGVVAAMTIPTLISNYKKQVVVTKLKSTNAIVNQALLHSIADNGATENLDYSLNADDFFAKYYAPYLQNVKICEWYEQESGWTAGTSRKLIRACSITATTADGNKVTVNNNPKKYLLKNGTGLSIKKNPIGIGLYELILDLNISKNNIVYGVDSFVMLHNSSKMGGAHTGFTYAKGDACSMIANNTKTSDRKTFVEHCKSGADHYFYGNTCAALIQCNNWKVPKDYPAKF